MGTQGTIKLGVVTAFTGVHAELTRSQMMGVRLAVEEVNARGGVLGREVVIIERDDGMDATRGGSCARELIEVEHVDLLAGTLSAASVMTVNAEAVRAGIPFMAICQARNMTNSEHLGPFSFHEALTPYMTAQLVAKWVTAHLGKRWYAIVYDFQFGHDTYDAFQKILPAYGGEIVGTTFVPMHSGKEVYERIFPEILELAPDVVSANTLGSDQVELVRAVSERGLVKETAVVHTISDIFIADNVPLSDLVGQYWGVNFYWGLGEKIPSAKRFVENFRARWGIVPSGYAGYAYGGIHELLAAAESTGVYPIDPIRYGAFLEGHSYEHYKGRQWWRPCDHQSFQDLYMMRFKGPEDSTEKYDIGEVVDTVTWDLDIEESCQHLGHSRHLGGHMEQKGPEPARSTMEEKTS